MVVIAAVVAGADLTPPCAGLIAPPSAGMGVSAYPILSRWKRIHAWF